LLAFQIKVIAWPALILAALGCNETEGFSSVVLAEVGVPLPAGVRLSPSHAAKVEKITHANSQPNARALLRRAAVPVQRAFASTRKAVVRAIRWPRPSELIRIRSLGPIRTR
jgi:hypothetical protein